MSGNATEVILDPFIEEYNAVYVCVCRLLAGPS
jgi:hypothetical protein